MKLKLNILLAICAIMFLTSACKEEKTQEQQQVPQVPAVRIEKHDVPLSFEYPARAKGYKDTDVRARVNGILLKRNYVEGSYVNEGDVLFQIDPEPYKATVQQVEGKLADAEAQLKAAVAQWNRIDKLYKEQIVSEKSRDEAKAHMDSLKATVESTKGDLKNAQLNLEYTTVKAPISGFTSMESQSEGNLISTASGANLLTTITQLDPIYIIFSVSDTDVFNMKRMVNSHTINNPDKEEAVAKIKFQDGSFYETNGVINFINPTIDQSTGSVSLRAVFPNPKKEVMPQQFVRIVIEGLVMPNAITIPKEAVMQGAKGAFVYTISNEETVKITNVDLGMTAKNGDWVVEKGLKLGDVILVGGLQKIRENMPVKPVFINETNTSAIQEDTPQAPEQ